MLQLRPTWSPPTTLYHLLTVVFFCNKEMFIIYFLFFLYLSRWSPFACQFCRALGAGVSCLSCPLGGCLRPTNLVGLAYPLIHCTFLFRMLLLVRASNLPLSRSWSTISTLSSRETGATWRASQSLLNST